MADNRIEIEIVLDDDKIVKGFARTKDVASKAGKDAGERFSKNVSSGLLNLKTVAIGVGAALAGIFTQRAIAAAAAQEQAVQNLNTSLRLAGAFSEEASRNFQDFASSLQASSRFGDEVILQQLGLARNFARTNEEAQALVEASVDLSEATGISLDSAVRNLGKTFSGLTGELGEVVPSLRNLTAEQLKAGQAIDLIANRFGGAAQANVRTFGGAIEQLGNTTEELVGAAKVKLPEPSVCKNSLAPPSPSGNLNVVVVVTASGASKAM